VNFKKLATKPPVDLTRHTKTPLPLILYFFLVAVTLVVYWPVVHCDFLEFDDIDYFTGNMHVQTGLNLANCEWAFTTGFASNWHPLTWISLMLDSQLFGHGPFGPHLVNLLLHTANTALLFCWLRKLTAATWKSALVAALFALHPLHVESVAWVAERKDVLSTFFGFISLLAYERYARERSSLSRPQFSVLAYVTALIFFALSLMSKPMLVTLPFILLLLDYWPLQRFDIADVKSGVPKVILEKVPFLILSLLSSVATFLVQRNTGAVQSLIKYSVSERLENTFVSYARYLGKTFWPASLANPYPHPGVWPGALVGLSVGMFVLFCVLAIVLARKYPFGFVGWFWFAGMLVPTIGLVQVGSVSLADRYTYLPLTGIFIIFAWTLGGIAFRWRGTQPAMITLAALGIILGAWLTRLQIGYWHDTGALFDRAMAVTKGDFAASNALGVWMSGQGEPGRALECFSEANRIEPDNGTVLFNLANSLAKTGHTDDALNCYRRALQLGPVTGNLLINFGSALASKKQYAEALTTFEMALKLQPDSVTAHNNLAAILFKDHRFAESAQHFQEALRFFPASFDPHDLAVKAQIYSNLGDALAQLGKTSEAMQSYQQGLQLEPDNARIQGKLQALGAR
jgi:tetratricopeptide (TPR) repeat protein